MLKITGLQWFETYWCLSNTRKIQVFHLLSHWILSVGDQETSQPCGSVSYILNMLLNCIVGFAHDFIAHHRLHHASLVCFVPTQVAVSMCFVWYTLSTHLNQYYKYYSSLVWSLDLDVFSVKATLGLLRCMKNALHKIEKDIHAITLWLFWEKVVANILKTFSKFKTASLCGSSEKTESHLDHRNTFWSQPLTTVCQFVATKMPQLISCHCWGHTIAGKQKFSLGITPNRSCVNFRRKTGARISQGFT